MPKINCAQCDKLFYAKPSHITKGTRFCSRNCKTASAYITYKCTGCNNLFKRRKSREIGQRPFCSFACTKNGTYKICAFCKKPFYFPASQQRAGANRECCSIKCRGKYFIKSNHHSWKGGVSTIARSGHKVISSRSDNIRILEHRMIAEKLLDRKLTRSETIHHINFKPGDNRPENLYLFNTTAEHSAYHAAYRRGEVGLLESNLI